MEEQSSLTEKASKAEVSFSFADWEKTVKRKELGGLATADQVFLSASQDTGPMSTRRSESLKILGTLKRLE